MKFGRVLTGVKPFVINGNVNFVVSARIALSDSTTVQAFIKDMGLKEFANYLLAATLATRPGLPVPTSIVARVSAADAPVSRIPSSEGGDFLVFASAAISAHPILQALKTAGRQTAAMALRLLRLRRSGL